MDLNIRIISALQSFTMARPTPIGWRNRNEGSKITSPHMSIHGKR